MIGRASDVDDDGKELVHDVLARAAVVSALDEVWRPQLLAEHDAVADLAGMAEVRQIREAI